jgi:hypothetical protein
LSDFRFISDLAEIVYGKLIALLQQTIRTGREMSEHKAPRLADDYALH